MYKRLFCAIGHIKNRAGRKDVPKWAKWFKYATDTATMPDEPEEPGCQAGGSGSEHETDDDDAVATL
eukprot:9470733-Pyramimonas_sp.AAC.1